MKRNCKLLLLFAFISVVFAACTLNPAITETMQTSAHMTDPSAHNDTSIDEESARSSNLAVDQLRGNSNGNVANRGGAATYDG